MSKWTIEKISLPLKVDWTISRSSTKQKQNYVIRYKDHDFEGFGEVAFNSRYDESAEEVEKAFDEFALNCPKELFGLESFDGLLDQADMPNALKFGIESAFVHFLARLSEREVQEILGVNRVKQVETSFSLPIIDPSDVKNFIESLNLSRFSALKIKVGKEGASDLVKEVHKYFNGSLRIDANEAFNSVEDTLKFCDDLKGMPIEFLEQPMPANFFEEYLELKPKSPFELMADESVTDGRITEELLKRFHGVNIKLMKAGGYFKAIKQLRDAKKLGLKTMVGCMIESSLGISSAMNIAYGCDFLDLDGFMFLEKDPYNLVYEEKGKLFCNKTH